MGPHARVEGAGKPSNKASLTYTYKTDIQN